MDRAQTKTGANQTLLTNRAIADRWQLGRWQLARTVASIPQLASLLKACSTFGHPQLGTSDVASAVKSELVEFTRVCSCINTKWVHFPAQTEASRRVGVSHTVCRLRNRMSELLQELSTQLAALPEGESFHL